MRKQAIDFDVYDIHQVEVVSFTLSATTNHSHAFQISESFHPFFE